jgi:hypothetical protein
MLPNNNVLKYLDESKKIGGIFGFVSNREYIVRAISDKSDFLQFMLYYVENNLNHFYYYFLNNFENKIRNEIINNDSFTRDRFLILLHLEIYNIYYSNVYGKEKELLLRTNKSINRTIERILKNYDPLYLVYLKRKGYGQLADLCFDIYLYYSFLAFSNDEFSVWIKTYKNFMEFEWIPMYLQKKDNTYVWNYNTFSGLNESII